MRRIWFSSQRRSRAASLSIATLLLAISLSSPAEASRNGVEERTNAFTVGITFKFGAVEQLCSGALLTPTLVVTAAHCVFSPSGEKGSDYYFTAPGTPLDAAINPAIIQPKVIKVFSDPNFDPSDANSQNDIAFLELDKSVQAKQYLWFATRAELNQLTASSTVAGYGYGRVYETGADYSIYPRKYLMNWSPIDSSTVLANTFSLTSATSAPCKGDSGGPILATLASGKVIFIGVLSGALNVLGGCGTQSSDGLYSIRLTSGYNFLPLISSIYNPITALPVAKKVTITCVKGKLVKKITAFKPVCPKGYTRKR